MGHVRMCQLNGEIVEMDNSEREVVYSTDQDQFFLNSDFLPNEFREQSIHLAQDIVHYICRHEEPFPATNKTTKVMRNLVDDMLKNRLEFMRDLVVKLNICRSEQLDLLDNLATQMFDDQVVTWGRIVTLHAFCGYLARYCQEREIQDCTDAIADILSSIVINRLGLWIVTNGGWAAFDKQFPVICMFDTSSIWGVVGFIGLLFGTAIAFYSTFLKLNSS